MKSTEEGYAERISLDIQLYGQAIEMLCSDGTKERIDPTTIRVIHAPRKKFKERLAEEMETRKSEVEVIKEISDFYGLKEETISKYPSVTFNLNDLPKENISTTFGESANSFVKE